jgi:hypothetical protein
VKTGCFSPLCDVDIGEALGPHTELEWVVAIHFDNVDFPLDSKRVVDQFKSNIVDNSEFRCIISACRQLLDNSFRTLVSSSIGGKLMGRS